MRREGGSGPPRRLLRGRREDRGASQATRQQGDGCPAGPPPAHQPRSSPAANPAPASSSQGPRTSHHPSRDGVTTRSGRAAGDTARSRLEVSEETSLTPCSLNSPPSVLLCLSLCLTHTHTLQPRTLYLVDVRNGICKTVCKWLTDICFLKTKRLKNKE